MIRKNKILIIGNGSSVLNYSFGEQIDKFSVVSRINNYSITKFEDYVGFKTDIWFNGANQNLTKRKKMPEEVVIFIPAEILHRKGETIHNRISKRLNISKDNYLLVPIETMEKYEKQLGVIRPTTGTSAILWAMDNYQEVIIHGFDFFIDSKSHYNENLVNKWLIELGINKKGLKHNMEAEKKYIEDKIQEHKIIKLLDYLNQ